MRLQISNGWSCLPCSFAIALNIPVSEFINMLGHDGSEEVYEELPGVKAGFHEQECIEVVQNLGYACTPIEIVPQMMPKPNGPVRPVWFRPEQLTADPEDWNWQRFKRHLEGTRGVITGAKKRINSDEIIGHAVAWYEQIYDPQGRGFIYPLNEMDDYGFLPRVYWKIQETINARTFENGSFDTCTEKEKEV